MFWFNKEHPEALYGDIRSEELDMKDGNKIRHLSIAPDTELDFRNMNLSDNSFYMVVFDPPHMTSLGKNSWMAKKYGRLDVDWRDDLRLGFSECFRVLKPNGTLIFKWNEYDIPVKEILKLTPNKPLFGHRSGKQQKTHWITFMKGASNE